MSRCSKIIAPGQSAFSSTAAELGGATKIEIGEDLSEADLIAARERLSERLSDPARTDVIAQAGDLGQSFMHVMEHLSTTGRRGQAVSALDAQIRAGLNISFLYPRQLDMQLIEKDYDGAMRTGAMMRSRVLYHRVDFAVGEVLHGIAHIAKGQPAKGLHHITNGFWHEPDAVVPRTAVGLLIEMGVLGPQRFFPMTQAAQRLRRRMTRDALSDPRFAPLAGLAPERAGEVKSIPGLEPIGWDWGHFFRAFSPNSVARHPHREGYEKAMGKLPDQPDGASLKAIYQAHCGDLDDAVATLSDLARLGPQPGHGASPAEHGALQCAAVQTGRGRGGGGASDLARDPRFDRLARGHPDQAKEIRGGSSEAPRSDPGRFRRANSARLSRPRAGAGGRERRGDGRG